MSQLNLSAFSRCKMANADFTPFSTPQPRSALPASSLSLRSDGASFLELLHLGSMQSDSETHANGAIDALYAIEVKHPARNFLRALEKF